MFVETNAYKVNYIGMVELGHYESFHEKIKFGLRGGHFWQSLYRYGHFDGVAGSLAVESLINLAKGALSESSEEERNR